MFPVLFCFVFFFVSPVLVAFKTTLIKPDDKLAKVLVEEFPCRPHWTKNTRDVFKMAVKNIDPDVSTILMMRRIITDHD